MLINVLRIVFTIVIGLVVFGWSFAAGDTVANPAGSIRVAWQDVRLEAMPDIPLHDKQTSQKQISKRSARKTKLNLTPAISRPDFGETSQLPLSNLQLNTVRPRSEFFTSWDSRVVPTNSIRSVSLASIKSPVKTPKLAVQRTPAPQATLHVIENLAIDRPSDTQLAIKPLPPERQPTELERPKGESKTVALQPIGPNIDAIAKHVDSHNYAVAAMEQQLEEQDAWDLESLKSAVEQIERIRSSQRFWSLYWELLDARKRRRMQSPFTLARTTDKLRERIFEVMVENQVQPENVSSLTPEEAKSQLEDLDRKVSDWK